MADIVIMPRLSLNEETSLLSQWYVSEGDTVAAGDKLFCIETDKSTMDVDSEFAGTVLKKYYSDYSVVQVLTPVCVIGQPGEEIPELQLPEGGAEEGAGAEETAGAQTGADMGTRSGAQRNSSEQSIKAMQEGTELFSRADAQPEKKGVSPRARRLAEQNGITEFQVIRPSGAENRILEEDIIRFMAEGRKPEVRAASGERKTVKLPKIRRVIAQNMLNSLQTTAQLTLNSVFNASGIQTLRERFKQEQGKMKKVTIGDLILYGVSRTLGEFSYMNAWMLSGEEAVEFADVNLGVAVDTDRGLMVPTIMAADTKSLKEVSDELKELAAECREGNIAPDKLKEATFTVTNLGSYGIRSFTPVLNPPQVGILGVGTIDYMVKKTKEGLLYYPACSLSLTIDHRYVDGGPAARFLKKLCENLETMEEWLQI